MGNRMLIDAAHPEETRVVVVRNNNRIEELDYEAATRKQLRGNIYLAKVTRVEPSLQAAFVDYGGNRHGFLAFNEIHPDYYQIPVADRQALLEQEAAEERAEEEADYNGDDATKSAADEGGSESTDGDAADSSNGSRRKARAGEDEPADRDTDGDDVGSGNGRDEQVESVGAGDAMEELPVRKTPRKRSYNIQEVIKRRQIILVQVVKEERGNKGAALTTYLSLAGRYCVLMPNTARGGGISRKITDAQDRKRLKDVAKSANVPDGMGLIVRTAGANRTKAEVKRDFDYLLRLWENVRDLTLKSTAPCLVYEEGSLIKRAIRDLYTKDIDSIVVEGEEGYKEAKDFMRMLMPSHARNVKSFKDTQPLFQKHSIENQLDVLFSPYVTLPSGGYVVINQTEALVAIDVNSGKATREHSIEDTALKTNLEAAEEISRQMRLRDLAGLIVIDFIDMEERRNNRSVERRLKDRLKSDRARIQVGRISHFGLLEMSRQRMRSGVLESSTRTCPTCEGRGFVRSVQSAALQVLRGLEEHLQKHAKSNVVLKAPTDVALYILNQKRDHLLQIEAASEVSVFVEADSTLLSSEFAIEKTGGRVQAASGAAAVIQVDSPFAGSTDTDTDSEEDGEGRSKKRRRRRGRRGSRQGRRDEEFASSEEDSVGETESNDEPDVAASPEADDEEDRSQERKSRRGSRGGRRRKAKATRADADESADVETGETDVDDNADEAPKTRKRRGRKATDAEQVAEEEAGEASEKPRRKRRSRRKDRSGEDENRSEEATDDTTADTGADHEVPTPAVAADANGGTEPVTEDLSDPVDVEEASPSQAAGQDTDDELEQHSPAPAAAAESESPSEPARRGWWQRR